MRKWKVLFERVTEYLQAANLRTAVLEATSAGVRTGDNWRMNEANSAFPRKVDCTERTHADDDIR